jgi:hypothetical protein
MQLAHIRQYGWSTENHSPSHCQPDNATWYPPTSGNMGGLGSESHPPICAVMGGLSVQSGFDGSPIWDTPLDDEIGRRVWVNCGSAL